MAVATAGNGTAIATPPNEREMTFVPFGSKETIKLSAKIVQTMVCVPTKSGKVCSEIEAMKFMMLCKARALNPFEGDAFLIGYDSQNGPTFSLITAHQAFLKRAEVHPEYDGMDSGLIVTDKNGELVNRDGDFFIEGDTVLGGWATVYFKNRSHPMRKRLRLAAFVKSYGRWKDDAAGMIVKCAEADALRSSFPTTLGGLYIDGEAPLQFNDVPATTVPEIPKGRSKIKKQAPVEPPPEDIDIAGGEIPNAEDEQIDEEIAGQWEAVIQAKIDDASNLKESEEAGALLLEKKAVLGKARFDGLFGMLQAANRDLEAKKGSK